MRGYICKNCGSNLDPGERCDCTEQEELLNQMWNQLISKRNDGQYTISNELIPDQEEKN